MTPSALELGLNRRFQEQRFLPEVAPIFKYYSVENEVGFVTDQLQKGANQLGVKSYLENSVLRFLGEFVEHVRLNKIDYQMKNSQIFFEGVASPVIESYKKLANTKGLNSREAAEAEGFKKIEDRFASNRANIALWISPPSIGQEGFGNYGFLFILVKGNDNRINEYILRYEGENSHLEESWQIYNHLLSLQPLVDVDDRPVDDQTEKGFLRDPLFIQSRNPQQLLAEIGFRNISNFMEFDNKLNKNYLFKDWLNEYIDLIMNATQELDPFRQNDLIERAKRSLAGIYNLAEDIENKRYEMRMNKFTHHQQSYIPYQAPIALQQYYYQKEAMVVGGGSCPAVTSNKSPFQNGWESLIENNGIVNHQSASELTSSLKSSSDHYDDYECPKCGEKITGEIKGSAPETWTQKCRCGYEFPCSKKHN